MGLKNSTLTWERAAHSYMPCRGLGHWKWSHVLTRRWAWPCSDITEIRTFERCNACLRTDPGPYPDSAPGPLRPCRGSPWTTPAPSPPSPGASSSCWSRSGLPRKKRGLSSSELRQIASSHSFLSNPPDGGDAAKNPLRPSNAVEQNSKKCTRQCLQRDANSPSVQSNPNCV